MMVVVVEARKVFLSARTFWVKAGFCQVRELASDRRAPKLGCLLVGCLDFNSVGFYGL